MTEYTIKDLKILETDTTDDPNSFTPKFEIPGKLYKQDYPKRLRHTFPDTEKWHRTVQVDGQNVERWKQYIVERYL